MEPDTLSDEIWTLTTLSPIINFNPEYQDKKSGGEVYNDNDLDTLLEIGNCDKPCFTEEDFARCFMGIDSGYTTTSSCGSDSENIRLEECMTVKGDQGASAENAKSLLCPYCGIQYSDNVSWRHHLNSVHQFNEFQNLNMEYIDENTSKCKDCKNVLKGNIYYLQRHKIMHLPFHIYIKCNICEQAFTRIDYYSTHFRKMHGDNSVGDNSANLKTPKYMLHRTLLCPFCGLKFPQNILWRQHLNVHHSFNNPKNLNMEELGNKMVKCRQCNRTLKKTYRNLQNHKILHLPYSQYVKCSLCKRNFPHFSAHKAHFLKKHGQAK